MGKLADLLRWKKEVKLYNETGKLVAKVYMRVLGDQDVQETYQQARIVSAQRRDALRNPESVDYRDLVLPITESSAEDCIEIIKAAKSPNWNSEAISITTREDEPKISEIAVDPDAPTLEEQEKLDAAIKEVDERYIKNLQEYVDTKSTELDAQLKGKSLEELRTMAQWEISNLVPLTAFLQEVQDQKVFRSVYDDKDFKTRSYDSVEEFRNAHTHIKQQLVEAYNQLEIEPDELKN